MIYLVKVREDLTGKQFGRLTVIQQVEDYIDVSLMILILNMVFLIAKKTGCDLKKTL